MCGCKTLVTRQSGRFPVCGVAAEPMKTRLLSLHHAERSGIVSCLAPILKKYKQAVNGFEDNWMKMDKDRAEALVTWVSENFGDLYCWFGVIKQ